jgi:hypothetical protein
MGIKLLKHNIFSRIEALLSDDKTIIRLLYGYRLVKMFYFSAILILTKEKCNRMLKYRISSICFK